MIRVHEMIRIEPVLELPDGTFLPLSGDLSPAELTTFLHEWPDYNGAESLRELLGEEMTLVPGGLRTIHTGGSGDARCSGGSGGTNGTVVNPGCCCGLEDWRTWLGLLDRLPVWMGHDPGVDQEFIGDKVHLSQEGQGQHIEIPLRNLPYLLAQARDRLLGLLALVEAGEGPEVAALLNRDLHITDPFP